MDEQVNVALCEKKANTRRRKEWNPWDSSGVVTAENHGPQHTVSYAFRSGQTPRAQDTVFQWPLCKELLALPFVSQYYLVNWRTWVRVGLKKRRLLAWTALKLLSLWIGIIFALIEIVSNEDGASESLPPHDRALFWAPALSCFLGLRFLRWRTELLWYVHIHVLILCVCALVHMCASGQVKCNPLVSVGTWL